MKQGWRPGALLYYVPRWGKVGRGEVWSFGCVGGRGEKEGCLHQVGTNRPSNHRAASDKTRGCGDWGGGIPSPENSRNDDDDYEYLTAAGAAHTSTPTRTRCLGKNRRSPLLLILLVTLAPESGEGGKDVPGEEYQCPSNREPATREREDTCTYSTHTHEGGEMSLERPAIKGRDC